MEYYTLTFKCTVKVCSRNEAETLAHDACLSIYEICKPVAEDGFYVRTKTKKRKLVNPFSLK